MLILLLLLMMMMLLLVVVLVYEHLQVFMEGHSLRERS